MRNSEYFSCKKYGYFQRSDKYLYDNAFVTKLQSLQQLYCDNCIKNNNLNDNLDSQNIYVNDTNCNWGQFNWNGDLIFQNYQFLNNNNNDKKFNKKAYHANLDSYLDSRFADHSSDDNDNDNDIFGQFSFF